MGKPSNEKLVASINESAQHIGAATLTFLAVCVYIGIAVASTTDEILLLGTNIGLPLFDVQIPLDKFYVLAPALLAFLHLHLLLLQYLLVSKVVKFCQEDNPPEEETDLFFPSLPISILLGQKHPGMVRVLLWLLLFTITIVLPVSLLIATQVRFLPHHSASITAWHKCLVLFDLVLIWYFRLRTPSLPGPEEVKHPAGFESHLWSFSDVSESQSQNETRYRKNPLEAKILKLLGWLGSLALTVAAMYFSILLVGESGIGDKSRPKRSNLLTRSFSENLSLEELVLIRGEVPEGKEPSLDHPRGVRLAERDLKRADFTRAILINADLRGADLTGTNFEKADLRFAKLSPSKGMDGIIEMLKKNLSPETIERGRKRALSRATRMQGARLRGADMRNANLFMADLRGANLEGAMLDGADLRLADLRGANFKDASLKGTNLSRSILNLADLRQTMLWGANLANASLLGADLWKSQMYAAELSGSDLRGAKLVEVEAMAANFSGAKVTGADFQNAWLNAAAGLALNGVDLRGAHLDAVDLCAEDNSSGKNIALKDSDLRFIDFEKLPLENWALIIDSLKEMIKDEPATNALVRFKKLASETAKLAGPPCLTKPGADTKDLLYYESQITGPLEDWSASAIGEQTYHDELASMLVEQACNDHELTLILLREVSGESVPRRRLLAAAIAKQIISNQESLSPCSAFRMFSQEQRDMIKKTSKENPLLTDG